VPGNAQCSENGFGGTVKKKREKGERSIKRGEPAQNSYLPTKESKGSFIGKNRTAADRLTPTFKEPNDLLGRLALNRVGCGVEARAERKAEGCHKLFLEPLIKKKPRAHWGGDGSGR